MPDTLLVGTRKGLFTLTRGKPGWDVSSVEFLAVPVTAVLNDPRDGARYVGLRHGHYGSKVHRSKDGGKTWSPVAAPAWPEGLPEEKDSMGRPWPLSLDTVWILEAGGTDLPGELWCGTVPGGLFRSTDHGDSWELSQSLWNEPGRKQWFGGGYDLPGIHSICVHPENPREVLIGVSCGGVWLTSDRGASWECTSHGMHAEYMPPQRREDLFVQDPHRIARCRREPQHLWAQHHNGVFRSRNGGRFWEEVTTPQPSRFGFAVAMHPEDAKKVWLVPAQSDEVRVPVEGALVVSRTTDGGERFSVLSKGLPQKHAYDLVYRHALDVNARGNVLAFGSTTGNLWISENEGDDWAQISAHLPPIYCVRWA
jgi:hypothetical protein